MKPTLLAYLAGFLDGEGSICLWHYVDPKGNRLTPKYHLILNCVNTRREVPALFQEVFGGRLRLTVRKNPKHKPLWRWEIGAGGALHVLRALRPYLRLKTEQADLAVEFRRGVKNAYGCRAVPALERERRLRLVTRMKELNRRGVAI